MRCLNCGSEVNREDAYCPNCGKHRANPVPLQQETKSKEFKMRTFDEEETSSGKTSSGKTSSGKTSVSSKTYSGVDNRNTRITIAGILVACVLFIPVFGSGGLFPDEYSNGVKTVKFLFDILDSGSNSSSFFESFGVLLVIGLLGVYLAATGVFIGTLLDKPGVEKTFSVIGVGGAVLSLLSILLLVLSADGSVFDFMEVLFHEKCPLAIGFWGAFGLYIASYVKADENSYM